MAPHAPTLFDLFGDLTALWPLGVVREHTGHPTGAPPDPGAWLAALNDAVRVEHVRTGASGDRVAIEADLTVSPGTGFPLHPEGWPFVVESAPDVEFRVRPFATAGRSVRLFASAGDTGVEVVLEGLPVEIRLPAGLAGPHPSDPDEVTAGAFVAGDPDGLRVVLRRYGSTSVFVHVRLHMTVEGEIHVQTAVPVSFGRCTFSGLPCRAVHDVRLLLSPTLAPDHVEWLRHGVEPWLPSMTGPYDGLLAVRSVHPDTSVAPLSELMAALNPRAATEPTAEFVLDDLVVPFFAPLGIPVPRHVTVGIRRDVLTPGSIADVFSFEKAPVEITAHADPRVALIVESFFFRSQPSDSDTGDIGLTFRAAIVFGKDTGPQHAFEFGLDADYTPTVGYRRDFSTTTGLPAPGTGPAAAINTILHWEIAGTLFVDVMGLRAGFSLGRFLGAQRSVGDSLLVTADLFVSMPPTGADGAFFRLRGLDGEKVAFAIEGLGWRLGGFHAEGLALPDGVVAWFGPVALEISELGLVAEDGASYLTFSGGLKVEAPGGFAGGASVRRLRFRVAGDPDRPPWKLDGVFVQFRTPGPAIVAIEAGGHYTEQTVSGVRVREFGMTGAVGFEVGGRGYRLGLDLIVGNRDDPADPAGPFDYLMVQAFFRGQIGPIGYVELTGARVLYARNMLPSLKPLDRESRDLRYLSWYRGSNPLTVPGDRRLAAWRADHGSWAFGIGAGASLASLGSVLELGVFVLGLGGPTEGGFLVVGEVFLLNNPKPLGYLAVEWDGRNDRFSMVVGIDARLDAFVPNAPGWLTGLGALTGTMFIGNSPGTFAIGRLADQQTWLGLRFGFDMWVRTSAVIALCVEIVDGGPKGFGVVARIEGGIDAGILKLVYNAGFGATVLLFTTGSTDYAAVIWVEAGLRFVLFGFLRLGFAARAEFRTVGRSPARSELSLELRLETPWFLPDITWTLDVVFGALVVEALSTAVSPLRAAAADVRGAQLAVHVARFDDGWDGQGVAPLHTVAALRGPTRSEADRLAAFAADTAARPVPTDATVEVSFTVPLNDRLGLGSGMAGGLGDQRSGDLTLRYELTGLAVRRRSRFGPDRSWKPLQQRVEPGPVYDPSGVLLEGTFAPQVLTTTWNVDVRVGDRPAPKKLLINTSTPYAFVTADPEGDELLAGNQPAWPCCAEPGDTDLADLLHQLDFHDRTPGAPIDAPARFSASTSRAQFPDRAWAREAVYAGLAPGTAVGAVGVRIPGPVLRAHLDARSAYCWARLAWPRALAAVLVAVDGQGTEVGRRELGPGNGTHQVVMLSGTAAFDGFEVWALAANGTATPNPDGPPPVVEIDWLAYVTERDVHDLLVSEALCDGDVPGEHAAYEGKGKLAFLPNHEYEFALTTRVTVAHPSTPPVAADVEEFVYVRTTGLPGLNAVPRTGAELEPYVRSAYTGGHGPVYCDEPVTLAFAEDFFVAVPLAVRPPGASEEQAQLLAMSLVVVPETAPSAATPYTSTAPDWITAHRLTIADLLAGPWLPTLTEGYVQPTTMITNRPELHRLAAMTQRSAVPCDLADPRSVIGTVLVAPPQGRADEQTGRPLWPAGAQLTARVRAEGAGFVDRRPFVAGDERAFTFVAGGAATGADAWDVHDGALRVTPSVGARHHAVFGDPDWDHLTTLVTIDAPGASAGLGFGIGAGPTISTGLFALVEDTASGRRLVLRRREVSGTFRDLAATPLPAGTGPVTLEVTTFDDRIRAGVRDAVIEADRDEVRAGRVCLTTDGPGTFASLQVNGLDMYRFAFATSRFRSFLDHIWSWRTRLELITPDMLGAGTTTTTVAALWATTAAEVATAMDPATGPAARERVFARWVSGLGVPFTDGVTALTMSALVTDGMVDALLLESPEPLDFTTEVRVTLNRLDVVVDPVPRRPRRSVTERLQLIARSGAAVAVTDAPATPDSVRTGIAIDVRVLQSGDARRALLVPVAGTSVAPLPRAGVFGLGFTMSRRRWETADPEDDVNTHRAFAPLTFSTFF